MQDEDDLRTPLVGVASGHPHGARHSELRERHSSTGGGSSRGRKQQTSRLSLFAPSRAPRATPATASQPAGPQIPAAAASGQESSNCWRAWITPIACLCWVLCSSGAILVNKHILVDLNFPFPCTVASLGITGTSIISRIAVRAMGLDSKGSKGVGVSWWFYCTYIVPAGLCLALAMQLGNTAYLYLSVAYVQMLKAFTPVVTMLFAFLFKLERPSLLLVSAVGLITAGVAVASWGEGAFSVTGVTAMVGSLICEALRLVLTQSLVSKREMHPVQILALIAPAATAWMMLISGLTEALTIHHSQALHDIMRHPGALAASAAAGFGANAMAMLVISCSGALTLKCLGLAKDVGLVLFGVLVLGEVVSGTQGMGYGISLLGFLLYNAARMWTGSQLAAHQRQQSSSNSSWVSKEAQFSTSSSSSSNSSSKNGGGKQGLVHQPAAGGAKGGVPGVVATQLRTPKSQPAAAAAAAAAAAPATVPAAAAAASDAAAPVPSAAAALLTSPSWVAVSSSSS